jgi:3,4-dihydroxy 2-butanone 4-phosphate synthase/GTP cyclohydrolase II
VLLYLAQEGAASGCSTSSSAYELQEEGLDTVEANLELGFARRPARLRHRGADPVDLGLTSIRLLTNNPKKIIGLEGYGLRVADQIPIQHPPNEHNREYLRAKREKLGHLLHHQGLALDEEMIHAERLQDRRLGRAAVETDLYGEGPAPARRKTSGPGHVTSGAEGG